MKKKYSKAQIKTAFELRNEGMKLFSCGKYRESISFFNKALKVIPDFQWCLYNKGEAFLHLDKFEEAVEAFNEAIEIFPDGYSLRYRNLALECINFLKAKRG